MNVIMYLDIHSFTEDVSWIWQLFTEDDDMFYSCKICVYKCMKFSDITRSVNYILHHLKTVHGIISGEQIITGEDTDHTIIDECTTAVDFLKGDEVM